MITVTGTRENYIAEMTADRGTLNATHCDIPVEQGGQNAYMRPGETLLSALGACMNITARKYLNRDGLDYESVTVKAEMARENGVTKIRTKLEIHGALSQADKDRIIAEVASCRYARSCPAPSSWASWTDFPSGTSHSFAAEEP